MTSENFIVTPDLYATKGNRFANYIVDLIILYVTVVLIFLVFGVIFYSVADDTSALDAYVFEEEDPNPLLDRLITSIVLAILYFVLELLTKGRSIGKYITKTKVVLEDGSTPRAADFLRRSFSRIIPFEQFSFLGDEGRGWHDTISKTYVVDIAKFEAKKKAANELDLIGVSQDL